MKITWNFTDTAGRIASEVLVPGGREGAEGFSVETAGIIQEADFPRAAAITVFARGNVRSAITWSVNRLFLNPVSAQQFTLTRGRLVGTKGDLRIEMQGALGSGVITFANCACAVASANHQGLTAFARYQFIGGRIV